MSYLVTRYGRLLILAGAVLFMFGLLQGVAIPQFTNPRMGLSAHLAAVQSGMALMIVGVVWSVGYWSGMAERVAFWSSTLGIFGVWLGLSLAAATGASQALPIAGANFSAGPVVEIGVSALVMISGVLTMIGWGLFLHALVRKAQPV